MNRPARRTPTPAGATGRTRSNLAGAFALCAVLALFVVWALPFMSHTVDDAWITFRYSLNWALGRGPYFNVAEHVEGYSNFLWTLLIAAAMRVGGDPVLVSQVLGILCYAGTLALLVWTSRRIVRGSPTSAAGSRAPWSAVSPSGTTSAPRHPRGSSTS